MSAKCFGCGKVRRYRKGGGAVSFATAAERIASASLTSIQIEHLLLGEPDRLVERRLLRDTVRSMTRRKPEPSELVPVLETAFPYVRDGESGAYLIPCHPLPACRLKVGDVMFEPGGLHHRGELPAGGVKCLT